MTARRARGFGLLAVLASGCAATEVRAPEPLVTGVSVAPSELDAPAPMSPAIRTGKLPNGLTYYVLAHGAPEQRAALWLAVDVGSVFEADDERGYAHFVEHMAFGGTRRFPKHEIFSFLERAGMTAGPDVNAVTGTEDTVYKLTVPTDDAATAGKGLDVLRDIAGDVTFDGPGVEHEKGILLEEHRMHQSAATRVAEQERALLFAGSRFADRLPIGTPESIRAATREALTRFYRRWYRPDAMAVVAVGDFDPQAMQAAIEQRFGDLANPPVVTPAPPRGLPRAAALRVGLATEREARLSSVAVFDVEERRLEVTKRDFRRRWVERLCDFMEDERLAELRDRQGSPLVGSQAARHDLTHALVAQVHKVTVKEGRLVDALSLVFREMGQLGQYGFLQSELDRARDELVSRSERFMSEYDRTPLAQRAAEILRHFTEREEIAGPERELAWVHELLPTITLAEVNALARARAAPARRVVAIVAPPSLAPMTEFEVKAAIDVASAGPFWPWTDKVPTAALMPVPPTPGRVVDVARDEGADAAVWTLSNGIRVVVKRTDFLKSSVGLLGWQSGGTSRASEADFPSARFAGEAMAAEGAGPFSPLELGKLMAGHRLSASITVGELGVRISGDATPENLERLLQLLYLRLTQSRNDDWAFNVWKSKALEAVRRRSDSPEQRFSDEVTALATGGHPRRRAPSADMVEAVDRGKVYAFWTKEMADLGGLTFVLVGNVDPTQLRPLVERYLASLPGTPGPRRWANIGVRYPTGKVEKTVVAGRAPKSLVWMSFGSRAPFSLDRARDALVLETLLRIRLRERLRDELGAVYGMSVTASAQRDPDERQALTISFPCAPGSAERLRQATFAELARLGREGPDAELLAKVAEQLRRRRSLDVRNNHWWLSTLLAAYVHGDDFGAAQSLDALLARVTAASVQGTVRRLYDEERYRLVVLLPEGAPAVGEAASAPPPPAPAPPIAPEGEGAAP
ncbi:MAG TPA: insulinase family protein [Polyangia bacterium]|nr:insulinase family protein [Polyangia bacterium]